MPAADPVKQRLRDGIFHECSSALRSAVIAAGEHQSMNGTARRPAVLVWSATPIEPTAGAGSIRRGGRLGPVLGLLSRHFPASQAVPQASAAWMSV